MKNSYFKNAQIWHMFCYKHGLLIGFVANKKHFVHFCKDQLLTCQCHQFENLHFKAFFIKIGSSYLNWKSISNNSLSKLFNVAYDKDFPNGDMAKSWSLLECSMFMNHKKTMN